MEESQVQGELLRGNIDTIILKCLFEGEKYGNEIMKDIGERTKGQFSIKQPTLYSSLTRLENQGLVTCTWVSANNGGRRKYFAITAAGRNFFAEKQREWEFSRTVVDKLISEKIFDMVEPSDPIKVDTISSHPLMASDAHPSSEPEAKQDIPETTIAVNSIPETKTEENLPSGQESRRPNDVVEEDATQKMAAYARRYSSYSDALAEQTAADENAPEPPQFVTFDCDDLQERQEKKEASPDELANSPAREPRSPEEEDAWADARKRLYAEPPANPLENMTAWRDAKPEQEPDNYKTVLSGLFKRKSETPVVADPERNMITAVAVVNNRETLPGGVVIRRHNKELSKEYNAKYYVYANKLRLVQYIILAIVMLFETLGLYLGLVVGARLTADVWLYYVGLSLALAFPLLAGAVYVSKPEQTQRIAEENKNTMLYRFLITLECIVLIVCVNILVDKNVLSDAAFLTRLILPCVLSTNFMVNTLLYRLLTHSGRYAVKQ